MVLVSGIRFKFPILSPVIINSDHATITELDIEHAMEVKPHKDPIGMKSI
jgi:hypothetical protein